MNESSLRAESAALPELRSRIRVYANKPWLHCMLLGVVGFLVRIPALQGELLWDDEYLIRANPFIKSPLLILEVFRHYLFPDSLSTHYRPVQNISYMADYLIWNGNTYGYHISNILWHTAAAILLYCLLTRLFEPLLRNVQPNKSATPGSKSQMSSWLAFFVALLWVVHPVHSAAVDYLSGRADSLAFFFGCGGWLLYLKGTELGSRTFRWITLFLAWLSGLLALCARESGCLWPAIFLLYLFVFQRSMKSGRRWILTIACLAMFVVYFGLRQLPGGRAPGGSSSGYPPSLRSVLMLRALGDYGRLMLVPWNLHMERTVYNPAAVKSETARWSLIEMEYLSVGGVVLLGTLILLARRPGTGQRLRIFGAAWFLLAYLPTSNLIELNATVAEHWLYLPSVGFLIFLAGCALDLPERWRPRIIAFASLAVVALGTRSIVRSSDWTTPEIFARHTIRSGGATVRVALLLGQVFTGRGDYVEAEKLLRRAVELSPDYPIARNNLADALIHLGKKEEAEKLLAESTKMAHAAMKDYPRTWMAALNLAHFRHDQKDDAGAIAVLEKARQDYPEAWDLMSSESELLRESGKLDAALNVIQPYAQRNWWHYGAWMATGRLLAQKGDVDGAATALRHASWLDLHETAALNLIAFVRMGQDRLEDACRSQRMAVARQPDEPRQYLLLSNILDKMGHRDEAQAALAEVSRLRSLAGPEKAVN